MSRDPYEYFRVEARELLSGLASGILQLEKRATPETTASLLRLAHTLKGAARVVRQPRMADQAHAIEEALAPIRDASALVTRELVERILGLTDEIGAGLAALDAPPTSTAPPATQTEDLAKLTRGGAAEIDAVLDRLGEARVQVHGLRMSLNGIGHARRLSEAITVSLARRPSPATGTTGTKAGELADELHSNLGRIERHLASAVEQVERELREAREAAERLRLRPASDLFTSLERVTRDAAMALGKEATFTTRGDDVQLEPAGLAIVRGALIQVVRNAVAHGIEPVSERVRCGKPRAGRVELVVSRRGNQAVFTCRDDGRGIDVDALRALAERRGLLTPGSAPLATSDVLRLLLGGGLTTARTVTHAAGRGVGLDVVRAAAEKLGGGVTIETEQGRSTNLTIVVPLSLSAIDALVVEDDELCAAIPLGAIRRTARIDAHQIARTHGGESIVLEGDVIPYASLAGSLGRVTRRLPRGGARSVVVVQGRDATVALGVDRLRGVATVIARPLPTMAPHAPLVTGVAIDADGTPQLVLDPAGLTADASRRTKDEPAAEPKAPAVVLVVDDSLTTRMMERSILESAGYEVDIATSGEEGIEKARRRTFDLFLVDVEMPGMDGFSFVEQTRADPTLRRTPAILVTSRNSPEDQRRGMDAGASGYVVKSEFDQKALLSSIRGLVGR
jgi:two-component system chemotaxis sensor kinase CheA